MLTFTNSSTLASLTTAQSYEAAVEILKTSHAETSILTTELCLCYFAIAKALGPSISRINKFEAVNCLVYPFPTRTVLLTKALKILVNNSTMRYLVPGQNVKEIFGISDVEFEGLNEECRRKVTSIGWKLYMRAYKVEIVVKGKVIMVEVCGSIRNLDETGKQAHKRTMRKELTESGITCTGGVLPVDIDGPELRRLIDSLVTAVMSEEVGEQGLTQADAVAAVGKFLGEVAEGTEARICSNFTNEFRVGGAIGLIKRERTAT